MEVRNAQQAREWLAAWGPQAFELNRTERLADDMRRCQMLSQRKSETERGYAEAEAVLRKAIEEAQ
jgi:hypothetical protein